MPDIHWFALDEATNFYDAETIADWVTDHGDGEHADEFALARQLSARQVAEDEVKDRLSVKYDPTTWDVDADLDGVSDTLPGRLKLITMWIYLYILASRRGEIPQTVKDNYALADLKLARIVSGADPLYPEASTRRISGNMTTSDFGQLTENGETENTAFSGLSEMI